MRDPSVGVEESAFDPYPHMPLTMTAVATAALVGKCGAEIQGATYLHRANAVDLWTWIFWFRTNLEALREEMEEWSDWLTTATCRVLSSRPS